MKRCEFVIKGGLIDQVGSVENSLELGFLVFSSVAKSTLREMVEATKFTERLNGDITRWYL